jgi:hypothetical protein
MQMIFIKKGFLFTLGSVCRVKRFSIGGKRFADDEEVETEVRKWLRQQSKDFYAWFRRTCKAMRQVYQCWWRICREINVFPGSNITCVTFLYPFVVCLPTLPRVI